MELESMSLEEAFERLEGTIARLESEDITLEESFLAYEEGMKLLKHCNDSIDRVEKQVLMISAGGELTAFNQTDQDTDRGVN